MQKQNRLLAVCCESCSLVDAQQCAQVVFPLLLSGQRMPLWSRKQSVSLLTLFFCGHLFCCSQLSCFGNFSEQETTNHGLPVRTHIQNCMKN